MYQGQKVSTTSPAAIEAAKQQAAWTVQHILDRCGAGNHILRLKNEKTEAQYNGWVVDFTENLRSFFTDYKAQERGIMANVTLSELGKIEKLEPVQITFNNRFNTIAIRVVNLQKLLFDKIGRLYQMPETAIAGDPIILEMRAAEVRRHVMTLPISERLELLLRSEDPFLIYAFESGPACVELIKPELLDRARRSRIERKRGAELEVLEDELITIDRLVFMFKSIENLFDWIHLTTPMLKMPETVLPVEKDLDPVKG